MDWIFDNFQIVILIALGLGSVVKSLLESKAKQKQEREEEYDPGDVFAPDEEYREPAMPTVPPPLTRQTVPHSQRESGYDEAVAIETAKALKHQQDLAEHLRQIRETKATTTGGAAATRARISPRGRRNQPPRFPSASAAACVIRSKSAAPLSCGKSSIPRSACAELGHRPDPTRFFISSFVSVMKSARTSGSLKFLHN